MSTLRLKSERKIKHENQASESTPHYFVFWMLIRKFIVFDIYRPLLLSEFLLNDPSCPFHFPIHNDAYLCIRMYPQTSIHEGKLSKGKIDTC